MIELTVPERDQPALAELIALSDDVVAALVAAIESAPPALLLPDLETKVAQKTGLSNSEASRIIRLLATLYLLRAKEEFPIDSLVEAVCHAAESTGKPELQPRDSFKVHLSRLLQLNVLWVSARALGIMREHKHVYCEARVLTDFRPVFGQDESPATGVIIHTLKIKYHHDSTGLAEFFVALSGDDVRDLQRLLARAIRKESSLRSLIQKTGLSCMDVNPHG